MAEALKRAEDQKAFYERNLRGKKIIYAYLEKDNSLGFIETSFSSKNYLHLTGLDYKGVQYSKRVLGIKSPTRSKEFYNRLGTDSTLINDVSFIIGKDDDETARFRMYTEHKLDNLSQLTNIASKAVYFGKYSGQQDFDVIINRKSNSLAFIEDNGFYIPMSSLYGKAEQNAIDLRDIAAIFLKSKDKPTYHLQYLNKNLNLNNTRMPMGLSDKLALTSFQSTTQSRKFHQAQLDKLISSYESSVQYGLNSKLKEISVLRTQAYTNDEAMETYIQAVGKFCDSLDSDFKGKIATKILETQKTGEPTTDSLIQDEQNRIERIFAVTPVKGISSDIQYFQPKPLLDVYANGTIAIPKPSIRGTIAGILHHAKSAFRTLLHRNSNAKRPKKSAKSQKKTISKLTARQPRPSSRQAEQSKSEKQPTVSDPPSQSSKPRKKQGNVYFSVALLHESSRQIKENEKLKRERGEITPKKHRSDNELE